MHGSLRCTAEPQKKQSRVGFSQAIGSEVKGFHVALDLVFRVIRIGVCSGL